jgi:hypothetical protein
MYFHDHNRIRIRKPSEPATDDKYQVILFCLANTPAIFQAYINQDNAHLLDICCIIYLNGSPIYLQSEEQYKNMSGQFWKGYASPVYAN